MGGRRDFRKVKLAEEKKEGRKTPNIVVTWGRIRTRGIRDGKFLSHFFFYLNEEKVR